MNIYIKIAITAFIAGYGPFASAQTAPTPPQSLTGTTTPQTTQSAPSAAQNGRTSRPGSNALTFTQVITNKAISITGDGNAAADLSGLANDPRLTGKDISDVEIQGTITPTISVGSNKRVEIQWTSVGRKSKPEQKKVLANPLQTNLLVGPLTKELPPSQPVKAAGNVDSLVTQILQVIEEPEAAATTAAAQTLETNSGTQSQSAPTSSGARDTGNNDKSTFQAPDPIIEPETPTEDPPVVAYTRQGCAPRVDISQNVAIVTEQQVIDGVPTDDCQDTLDRLPIKFDRQICDVEISLEDLIAQPMVRRYYVDMAQEIQYIDTECQVDPDAIYPITENPNLCGWILDKEALTATKLVKLVYTNTKNSQIEVSPCQPSDVIAPLPLIQNTAACDLRNDYSAGISYQRTRYDWSYNDQLETNGICEDTGVTYPHYEETQGCTWEHNLETGEAYATSRTAIKIDGQIHPIDQICTPDAETTTALLPTNDGCMSTFVDDYPNNQTYGTERLYYTKTDGNQVFVTACAKDTDTVYPHKTRTASWANDDDKLLATPLKEIYILTPNGENVRSPAQLRDGTIAMPYDFIQTNNVTDQISYAGCMKTTSTLDVEQYSRPDNSTYNKPIGPGDPIGPINACGQIIQTPIWRDTNKVPYRNCTNNWYAGANGDYYAWTCVSSYTGHYQGTRILQRDDGAQMTQTSQNINSRTWTNTYQSPPYGQASYPPYPDAQYQATFTGNEQIQWNQAEGW